MVDWKKIRNDFPITERFIYLDHASAGPMPKPVRDAALRYYDELSGFADFSWNRWLARREEVRRKIAAYIHAEPEEIAFTNSTSHGMNLVADLIADKGSVLTNTLEFPATTVPWIHRKVKVHFQKPTEGILHPEQIKKSLKPAVKTILTSFVQYQNGFRQDLEAIGAFKQNRFFVVNATQGFGYLPIDVKRAKIDFLVTNSYKWMFAGYGGGILYISKKRLQTLRPRWAGWRSVPEPETFENRKVSLRNDAARFELGSPPFPHIFALGASIEYLTQIGISNVQTKILNLTDFLIQRLKEEHFEIFSPLESRWRSGIVVFKVKNAEKLTNQLLARRIYVSPRGGGIRVAPHLYNTEDEIELLIKAIKEEETKL